MTPVTLTIRKADGHEETVTVRGIPVRAFEAAARAYEARDEFTLIGLACDRPASWVRELDPDSLTALAAALQRTNGAFFAWWARRQMMGVPPAELLRLSRDLPAAPPPVNGSPSLDTSPASPSPPA